MINPQFVEGQVEGGVAMGVGFGVMEEMVLDRGRVRNPQLTDYIVPTALDVPEIITSIVERPEPTGPYGAKGIGEPSLLPTAPAIVNAIQNAVGCASATCRQRRRRSSRPCRRNNESKETLNKSW